MICPCSGMCLINGLSVPVESERGELEKCAFCEFLFAPVWEEDDDLMFCRVPEHDTLRLGDK